MKTKLSSFYALLGAFAIIASTSTYANFTLYYPKDFQDKFNSNQLKNNDLKQALFTILSSNHLNQGTKPDILVKGCNNILGSCYKHISLGYYKARMLMFNQIDVLKDRAGQIVQDVYCHREISIRPNTIPSDKEMNTEHTWPQSKFTNNFDRDMQKSDLHHLYPADPKVNGIRGNFPFAEVNGQAPTDYCSASQIGSAIEDSASSKLPTPSSINFEPPAGHRGKVARSIFYFAIRYQMPIDDFQEYNLRKWNKEEPVTQEDLNRNESIFQLQGDRNPFIDNEQLVDSISNF